MARGIPFSESVAFSAAGAGTTDAVLVSNPDTDAYLSVHHVDTTLGTNITSFKLGWKKGTDFEAFLDSRLDTQLIGVFQMPLSTPYVAAKHDFRARALLRRLPEGARNRQAVRRLWCFVCDAETQQPLVDGWFVCACVEKTKFGPDFVWEMDWRIPKTKWTKNFTPRTEYIRKERG